MTKTLEDTKEAQNSEVLVEESNRLISYICNTQAD